VGGVVTWLAWRQLRFPAFVAVGILVALVVELALTGPHLLHVYDTVVRTCARHGDCSSVTASFQHLAALSHPLSTLVTVVPILLGVFWGAPLVAREMESGTYRLAWTQGVTRVRWIVVRLALVVAVAVVITAVLSVATTWWQSPVDRLNNSPFNSFETRDLVPVAYAAFAVALGALLGAILRRTVLAMAATLAIFAGVRVAVGQWIRPRLFAPLDVVNARFIAPSLTGTQVSIRPPSADDWVLSNDVVNASGRVIGQNGGIGPNGSFGLNVSNNGSAILHGVGHCPNRLPIPPGGVRSGNPSPATQAAIQHCVDSFHLRQVLTYQPASRYWPLQWSEAAIFLALAIALGAGCVWWVRRRLT